MSSIFARRVFVTAIFSLTLVSASVRAGESATEALVGLRLYDIAGQPQQLGDRDNCRGIALVFISSECPISNQYVTELNRIYREFRDKPVEFYGVVVDPVITRSEIAKYIEEFKVEFPVLFDSTAEIATACQPTHVPQAVVLDAHGKVAYRGRIDNQYAAVGRRRDRATEHDLAAALTALAAGREPEVATTDTIGCKLEPAKMPEKVTFNRHVAPLLFARCATCHRPGEVAPFSLLSFEDASKRAAHLAEVTHGRIMPPWHARPGYGEFRGERRLSQRELDILAAWAKAEAPQGEAADLPLQPKFAEGWQLGKPDLVVAMREAYTVPASGPDVFRFFVSPIDIPENKVVKAVEFRAGNPRVVHHAILFLDTSGVARKRDDADPEPGYTGFVTGGFRPAGTLGFWAPGYTPRFLPEGVGQRLPKGADLAMQLHYHPSGREEVDRSQIGIYFADKPVERYTGGLAMINFDVDIPAGEPRHKMTYGFTTPVEIELMDITPHMHMIGREMKIEATTPDGAKVPLVWSDWNFNWQEKYLYRQPLKLPPGTRIELEAWYDNTTANPSNPNSPPARVKFGEETTDEMCICAMGLIVDEEDRNDGKLQKAVAKQMMSQLSDPRVMAGVMQMVARGTAPGDGISIKELFGSMGNDKDDDDDKAAKPAASPEKKSAD